MVFSNSYALLFGLAGFAAATYHLKVGESVKWAPLIGLIMCVLYTLENYNAAYAFLTLIEYAVGFGLAHAVVGRPKDGRSKDN
jgi:hypothetical protein